MICPRCKKQVSGNVCTICGTVLSGRGKSTGLVVLCIVLAVMIAACAALYFFLPAGGAEIGVVAKNYVTAAFYTDNLINNANSYLSYDDYKEDLDIAIAACKAIQGGGLDLLAETNLSLVRVAYAADGLEGLDTDGDGGYSGGYTDDASINIDNFLNDMKKDAAIAKKALQALDKAVDRNTSKDDIQDALKDAKNTLKGADNATVVVGSTAVTFGGIMPLDGINTAFIGADIVIGKNIVYLGADGSVLFNCDVLDSQVTVVDSNGGNAVVMETGNMTDLLQSGALLVVTMNNMDEAPQSAVFSDATQFNSFISKEIGASLGFDGTATETTSSTVSSDTDTESGVYINAMDIIGTWRYSDAAINPWATLDENEQYSAQTSIESHKKPAEFDMYEGKAVEQYLIFRSDGTGIIYYDVEGVGKCMYFGFWWRIDQTGAIIVAYGVTAGYEFTWTENMRKVMENFQNGDYSDFTDTSGISRMRMYGSDIYDFMSSDFETDDDATICIVYKRVSESTDFSANS